MANRSFCAPSNLERLAAAFRRERAGEPLRFLLETLPEAAAAFAAAEDPLARARSLGELNRAFFAERLRAADEVGAFGAEPLHYSMFLRDSVYHGGLNEPGAHHTAGTSATPLQRADDQAWGAGRGGRTAAQATAEWYGLESPVYSAVGGSAAASHEVYDPRAPRHGRSGWGAALAEGARGRGGRGDALAALMGEPPARGERDAVVPPWRTTRRPPTESSFESPELVSSVRGWHSPA